MGAPGTDRRETCALRRHPVSRAGRAPLEDRPWDAANVAELLAANRLPLAYAPPEEVQVLRDWSRQRNRLSRNHARILHGVKSLMNSNNRPGPERLTSARLTGYLTAYGEKLPERHVRMLWQNVRQLSLIEEEIDVCEREIVRLLAQPRFAAAAALLVSIPGVGPVTSATVLAEIGDFRRFPDGKAIGRYAGLTPRLHASGGKERHGHISKTGPSDLRWVLQQAAWTAIRCDAAIKKQWLKMSRGDKKKSAAVGIARKLLVLMRHLVVHNQTYESRVEAPQAAATE